MGIHAFWTLKTPKKGLKIDKIGGGYPKKNRENAKSVKNPKMGGLWR